MPKFDKPKLNKSQLNKSQFDDRPNQNKSFPSEAQLPAVVLDETIVAGTRQKPINLMKQRTYKCLLPCHLN